MLTNTVLCKRSLILICVGIGPLDCNMPYRASDIAEIPRVAGRGVGTLPLVYDVSDYMITFGRVE